MSEHVYAYELLGISKERADEILEHVEHAVFMSEKNIDSVIVDITNTYDDPKEAFLAGMVYGRIISFLNDINSKVYK